MDMDEVTVVTPGPNNLSGSDWWTDVTEEEAVFSLPLDGSEGGLWSGNFVPPPPRPLFLDEGVTTDGLTTCDLCSWAWEKGNAFTLDAAMEAPGELGWVLTLVIVSLISALLGAIVMIIVLHCKRLKSEGLNDSERPADPPSRTRNSGRPPISTPDDKSISTITPATFPHPPNVLHSVGNNGVWSWLSRRSAGTPSQLDSPTSPAENHYTHMDETYNGVGEALYAELDRESTVDSNSPAYQNSAYTDPDAPSAPSSAYYSDLSVTTVPDRAYEVVGLSTLPVWNSSAHDRNGSGGQPPVRLASISESVSVPSDYV